MDGKIISINLSKKKGTEKKPIPLSKEVTLKENFGLLGDAHSGTDRQVSILGWERIVEWEKAKSKKLKVKISPGDFAENITTVGIDWSKVTIGERIEILPSGVVLEVIQIGKPCHSECKIRQLVGDCLMPKEGIFAKVIKGGKIAVGNKIKIDK